MYYFLIRCLLTMMGVILVLAYQFDEFRYRISRKTVTEADGCVMPLNSN